MDVPPFLIVTPSYNQDRFISETIDSVLTQKSELDHYLVVDGDSNDETVKILKKYRGLDWISEPDKGQTDALNKGILTFKKRKLAKNAIFAYLNSDDVYIQNALVIVRNYFKDHPSCNWLTADAEIIDQDSRPIQNNIRLYKKLWRFLPLSLVLPILNPIVQPATFIRWSVVQETGLFNQELDYTMDYEYWLRLLKKVGPPAVISQKVAQFRVHTHSKGGHKFKQQFAEQYQVAAQMKAHPFSLQLQKLHNLLITTTYTMIK